MDRYSYTVFTSDGDEYFSSSRNSTLDVRTLYRARSLSPPLAPALQLDAILCEEWFIWAVYTGGMTSLLALPADCGFSSASAAHALDEQFRHVLRFCGKEISQVIIDRIFRTPALFISITFQVQPLLLAPPLPPPDHDTVPALAWAILTADGAVFWSSASWPAVPPADRLLLLGYACSVPAGGAARACMNDGRAAHVNVLGSGVRVVLLLDGGAGQLTWVAASEAAKMVGSEKKPVRPVVDRVNHRQMIECGVIIADNYVFVPLNSHIKLFPVLKLLSDVLGGSSAIQSEQTLEKGSGIVSIVNHSKLLIIGSDTAIQTTVTPFFAAELMVSLKDNGQLKTN